MFKDAAALDRQRTATSFDKACQRYAAQAEKWFDGSVGSVDARLASCERLLHSARATVGRLSSTTDARPYLHAAADLENDRRALVALRDDLLTGASSREDVIGPPGWRTAKPAPPQGASAGSNKFENPAPRTSKPRYLNETSVTKVKTKALPSLTSALHQPEW